MLNSPNEIINLILSFRENHPTSKIIKPLIEKYNTQYIFTEDDLDFFNQCKIRMLKFNEHYFETLKYLKKQYSCLWGWDSIVIVMKIPNDESTSFVLIDDENNDEDDDDDDDDDDDENITEDVE